MHELEPVTNPFDALRREDHDGEHWMAREICGPLTYTWRGFSDAIERGRVALRANGQDPDIHIKEWNRPSNGFGRGKTQTDYRLTREGVYAIIQGGDPRKPEIAAGWAYFRDRTRQAEAMIPRQREPMDELELAEKHAEVAARNVELVKEKRAALEFAKAQMERAEFAETKLGIAAPKADAWDALANAKGDFSVADAAKILCRDARITIGRDRLFDLMSEWGWVFRQKSDNRWRADQDQVDLHRLAELPTHRYDAETGEKITNTPQVRVTAKGIKEIRERMVQRPPLFELEAAA